MPPAQDAIVFLHSPSHLPHLKAALAAIAVLFVIQSGMTALLLYFLTGFDHGDNAGRHRTSYGVVLSISLALFTAAAVSILRERWLSRVGRSVAVTRRGVVVRSRGREDVWSLSEVSSLRWVELGRPRSTASDAARSVLSMFFLCGLCRPGPPSSGGVPGVPGVSGVSGVSVSSGGAGEAELWDGGRYCLYFGRRVAHERSLLGMRRAVYAVPVGFEGLTGQEVQRVREVIDAHQPENVPRATFRESLGARFEVKLLRDGMCISAEDLEGLEDGRHIPDEVFEGLQGDVEAAALLDESDLRGLDF